jgi:hypothetical protein
MQSLANNFIAQIICHIRSASGRFRCRPTSGTDHHPGNTSKTPFSFLWAANKNSPVFLGEFCAKSKGDQASRALWLTAIQQAAEEGGFSSSYWMFCSSFYVYYQGVNRWTEDFL